MPKIHYSLKSVPIMHALKTGIMAKTNFENSSHLTQNKYVGFPTFRLLSSKYDKHTFHGARILLPILINFGNSRPGPTKYFNLNPFFVTVCKEATGKADLFPFEIPQSHP